MFHHLLQYFFITFGFISYTLGGYPTVQLGVTTLKATNLFFRHGARTPTEMLPIETKLPYMTWTKPSGTLTKVGKEKMFKLGLKLREMYKEFLNSQYLSQDIQVTATSKERTVESARSFLAGFFNSEGYKSWSENIPAPVVPIVFDDTVDKSNIITSGACKKFTAHQFQAVKKAIKKDTIFQDVYNYLSLYSGLNISGMYNTISVWDLLDCLAHNNRKLPYWASFVYPVRMSSIMAKVLHSHIVATETMIRLSAGLYIKELHDQFNDVVQGKIDKKKFIIHAGRNASMTANLGAFGVYEKIVAPGDAIILELHEIPYAGFFVQLLYVEAGGFNITAVPIKTCSQPCPLEKFNQLTKDIIPENWDEECKTNNN